MLTIGLAIKRLPAEVKPPLDGDVAKQKELTINKINRVIERFHATGMWKGLVVQGNITPYTTDGVTYITLPRWLQTCLKGGKAGTKPSPTQSQWHQFINGGHGIRTEGEAHWGPPQDMGEGFMTFRDIEDASELTFSSDQTETAETYLWIRGKNEYGKKVFSTVEGQVIEGERLDLSGGPVTTANTYSSIYAVTKDLTKGNISVELDDATLIATYEPSEEVVSYRRYLVHPSITDFVGIFKRKAVWQVCDNDILYPPSLEALKLGLTALNFEEEFDAERGEYYMRKAIELLNAELEESEAGSEGHLQFSTYALGGQIPYIN
jgi:hypothetical protein